MQATSINIQPCKVGSSESHNRRLKPLDYIRSDLSHFNESWSIDNVTLVERIARLKHAYHQAKGKKMHAKATPLREGVIVIKEDTSLSQLHRFAQKCEEQWGIKALQIHTHKDEGHMKDGQWTPNLHAHIVWQWADDNGVTKKLNRFDMSEMQTLLADCLEMERGVSSDKKHLSSLQFKTQEEENRLVDVEYKLQNTSESILRAQEALKKYRDDLLTSEELKELKNSLKTSRKELSDQILQKHHVKWVGIFPAGFNYEEAYKELTETLSAHEIVPKSTELNDKKTIEKLKDELESTREEYSKYVNLMKHIAGEQFKTFLEDVKRWTRACFTEFQKMYMWMGGKVNLDKTEYSTDTTRTKLLVNGRTIDQFEADRKRAFAERQAQERRCQETLERERSQGKGGFRR